MEIEELAKAAKVHAERVKADPEYKPYRRLIKECEAEFKKQAKEMAADDEWLNRAYDI